MPLARRATGLLAGLFGATGVALCAVGLYGVWLGYTEVMRRVDRVFGGADQALAKVQDNLGRSAKQLRETETELEAVRKHEADSAARPPAERPARREASRKAVEALGPGVAEARSTLVKATEAALVANGLLDALTELPVVEKVNVDVDRLKETSDRLGELTERSNKLAAVLARAGPTGDVGDESSRAVEAVRRPIALAEAGSKRLDTGRQSIATAHARIRWWVNGIALVLALVLVWIGAGQFSLMAHGWKWVWQRRPGP